MMSDSEELKRVVGDLLRKNNVELKESFVAVLSNIPGKFVAEGLIPTNVEDEILQAKGAGDHYALASKLLSACRAPVVIDPEENFPKFIRVLKKYSSMKKLAEEMESEFEKARKALGGSAPSQSSAGQQGILGNQGVCAQPVAKPPSTNQDQGQEFTDNGSSPQVPPQPQHPDVYDMGKSPHGKAVIFNFIGEEDYPRHYPVASRKSVKKFKDTFESLDYEVDTPSFLSKDDMIKRLTENVRNAHDSFVCCIMAHGENGKIVARNDKVDIRDLQKEVGEKCPKLRGKPKIFIVLACRGGDPDVPLEPTSPEENEALPAQLSREADFYIAYSTTEGHITMFNTESGGLYLNTLCDVFKEKAAHLTLDEMVMEVHHRLEGEITKTKRNVEHIEMGQVMHTLRGPVRFKKN